MDPYSTSRVLPFPVRAKEESMSQARISAERLTAHILIAILVCLLLYFLLPLVWRYLSPFIIAIPIAALLHPLSKLLEEKCHFRHFLAVIVPIILLIIVILVALGWFLSFGINQITYLLSHTSDVLGEGSSLLESAVNRVTTRFNGITAEDTAWLRTLISNLMEYITTWATSALNVTVNWATSIPYLLLYLNFLVFGVFFIAKDYDKLLDTYRRGFLGNPASQSGKLTNSAVAGLMGWLRCQAAYAILSLVVGSIYWTAFGYQYGILISVAAAILEFLPIVGNGTIYLPWGIIGILVGKPRGAILALILFFSLLFIRRVTEPKLLSQNIGVSPLLSLISLFVGLKLGGILGMIGSPMIAAVLSTLREGEFFRTVMHDAHVCFTFLKDRWHGISVPDVQTASPPEAPETPAGHAEEKPSSDPSVPGALTDSGLPAGADGRIDPVRRGPSYSTSKTSKKQRSGRRQRR